MTYEVMSDNQVCCALCSDCDFHKHAVWSVVQGVLSHQGSGQAGDVMLSVRDEDGAWPCLTKPEGTSSHAIEKFAIIGLKDGDDLVVHGLFSGLLLQDPGSSVFFFVLGDVIIYYFTGIKVDILKC